MHLSFTPPRTLPPSLDRPSRCLEYGIPTSLPWLCSTKKQNVCKLQPSAVWIHYIDVFNKLFYLLCSIQISVPYCSSRSHSGVSHRTHSLQKVRISDVPFILLVPAL